MQMISKIYSNIMGTASLVMQIKGMRKAQDFTVYPISKTDSGKIITVQSDTRIGQIDLNTGKGIMSQPHQSGAYFVHLQLDKKVTFQLSDLDTQALRMAIFTSADEKAGNNGVIFTDNSGAIKAL
jgi:hypothetical protein